MKQYSSIRSGKEINKSEKGVGMLNRREKDEKIIDMNCVILKHPEKNLFITFCNGRGNNKQAQSKYIDQVHINTHQRQIIELRM